MLDVCVIDDHDALQASPEFKGIKTEQVAQIAASIRLQASPEFKGIKTAVNDTVSRMARASSQP